MLFSDSGSGRAAELAAELGGEAVGSNAELAERADLVVLAVKPAKLDEVAPELGAAKAVVSLLGATSLERLQAAFPDAEVLRVMPNVGVEVRKGVLCVAGERRSGGAGEARSCSGTWSSCPTREFDAATAVMGCAPAYLALAVEAIADAGAADGLDPELARELVVETAAGTAELLRDRHPGRRPQGGRLARRQHRGRAGGARPRRRPRGLRGGGAGLAGEDARVIAAGAHPRRRRRLRQRALPRLHHPDLRSTS